ncbi:MAG: hypothetical protein KA715_10545 [Xanthomonadaceae bacterium]|nr:hypothetical protein [Xanthomonadaceae bacterium]
MRIRLFCSNFKKTQAIQDEVNRYSEEVVSYIPEDQVLGIEAILKVINSDTQPGRDEYSCHLIVKTKRNGRIFLSHKDLTFGKAIRTAFLRMTAVVTKKYKKSMEAFV